MSRSLPLLLLVSNCQNVFTLKSRPVVKTKKLGAVEGLINGDSEMFLGLHYAKAPIDALRFKPAERVSAPYAPPGKTFDASNFCYDCTQDGKAGPDDPGISEDCLCLNIWRPANMSQNERLPVYFWIHGGGFMIGSGSQHWTTGQNLAPFARAIVVTINYRLGVLGFLPTHDESAPSGTGGVQENIEEFGGDPGRVTIGGQSAGAMACCVLSVSPAARGLFHQIIAESGPCIGLWKPLNSTYGRSLYRTILNIHNATSLDDLRRVQWEDLVWPDPAADDILFNGYFLDGYIMPEQPEVYMQRGKFNVKNAVFGANSMDGVIPFGYTCDGCSAPADTKGWKPAMQAHWGPISSRVLAQYPLERFRGEAAPAFVRADADATVVCPSFFQAVYASAAQGVKAWSYLFDYSGQNIRPCDISADISDGMHNPISPANCTHKGQCGDVGWASHCAELPFVFGTTEGASPWDSSKRMVCRFSAIEERLKEEVMTFWKDMITTGAPAPTAGWPAVDLHSGKFEAMLIDREGSEATDLGDRANDCSFWQRIYHRERKEPSLSSPPNLLFSTIL